MRARHSNIPIFLPELACPHRCIFCNQARISGQVNIPTRAEVEKTIEQHLRTIPRGTTIQVAFFGGSFTGLPVEVQASYLDVVQPYLRGGTVSGIRVSTRPDYISSQGVDMLVERGVVEIELGAQSCDDTVLQASGRGHTSHDIRRASQIILSKNVRLGLQMMIGLPGDTLEKSLATARTIVELGAHSTRIYPTLVIRDTPLATLYERGLYQPLSLSQAVAWTAELYQVFEAGGVSVLRVGLHPNDDLGSGKSLVDGPYHPSFKELVLSRLWLDVLEKSLPREPGRLTIRVPAGQINHAIGYHSENRQRLKDRYGWIQIQADTTLQGYDFSYSYH